MEIQSAMNLIKAGEKLSSTQIDALAQFADLFVKVTLKDPSTSGIVREVNLHHHTAKACRKYGTECRFNFPKFPTYRTIIAVPSNIAYPSEEERKKKMKAHSQFLTGVK